MKSKEERRLELRLRKESLLKHELLLLVEPRKLYKKDIIDTENAITLNIGNLELSVRREKEVELKTENIMNKIEFASFN